MSTKYSYEEKANIIRGLVRSASLAHRNGFHSEEWSEHLGIQEIVSKYELHYDILKHIGALVWTFRQ